jgi:uncharacterized protein YndB with AHSA1/START domain
MINTEYSVIVKAPVERVWGFMSDFDKTPLWDPEIVEVKWQGPINVGIESTAHVFVRRTVNAKITDWEPNHKIGIESKSGGVKGLTVITMEPVEIGKTRLTRSVNMEIEGFLKLIQPYISYKSKGYNVKRLDNVKRLVEARSLAESI